MDIDPNVVIDRLGGTTQVAKICDIQPPSVHEWRSRGIPKARLQYLRLAYPEAFEPLEAQSETPVASDISVPEAT